MSASELSEGGGDDALISRIHDVLADTQDTIRAFDTKAEILAAGVALVVGLINDRATQITEHVSAVRAIATAGMVAVVGTVICCGLVLWPWKTAKCRSEKKAGEKRRVYYVTASEFSETNDYASAALETNWITEMSCEIVACSGIRARKEKWFRCALILALIAVLSTGTAAIWSLGTISGCASKHYTNQTPARQGKNNAAGRGTGASNMGRKGYLTHAHFPLSRIAA